MIDLNELFVYLKVVEQGGFAAAARQLGMPKSTVSRKVGSLEARLGFRLIQRSTRYFQVTEIGQDYYRHCQAMMAEVEAAESVVKRNRAEPCGTIRISCTTLLLNFTLAPMLASFMNRFPRVELQVKSFNRKVDVISEGFDLSLGLAFLPLENSDLVMKPLARCPQVLVGCPQLLARHASPRLPAQLAELPSVEWERTRASSAWQLSDGEEVVEVRHQPRLLSDDATTVKQALLDGVGIGCVPHFLVASELQQGTLSQVLPAWAPAEGVVVAMFASRRGLLPSVRALIDYLDEAFQKSWGQR
ncbi:MAG: LysR substrate-binding domain-containing protein [Pseudomonas sp.]